MNNTSDKIKKNIKEVQRNIKKNEEDEHKKENIVKRCFRILITLTTNDKDNTEYYELVKIIYFAADEALKKLANEKENLWEEFYKLKENLYLSKVNEVKENSKNNHSTSESRKDPLSVSYSSFLSPKQKNKTK
ncbi:MAG: hypothetical protein LBJ09_03670 [Clostridiales bacterium]|nr:hypothetical protein [Clostridiales bacterium]